MTTTREALLSRDIPNVIVENLLAKDFNLTSLNALSDTRLKALGLSGQHIDAIRDTGRPSIPRGTLQQVLDESWRTCCVCHRPSRPIVVHHIKEWSKGGTHDEHNLAILCLEDHDAAHLSGGLSLRLTAADIREAKKRWIVRAQKIRDNHHEKFLSAYHRSVRWYWIHVNNLNAKISGLSNLSARLGDDFMAKLRAGQFVDSAGNINPSSMWDEKLCKPEKDYLFDSGDAQLMGIYVSDLFGQFIAHSAVLDLTDMLDNPPALKSYVATGSLVYFRDELQIPNKTAPITATITKSDVHIQLTFDPWTALNQTAKGIHLVTDMAVRSVVGEVSSMVQVGKQLRLVISPLGISPDFILHDPAQGAWVKGMNNVDYRKRRQKAKDA